MVVLGGWVVSYERGTPVAEGHAHATPCVLMEREVHLPLGDWYSIAEQPASAPDLAQPEGRAALTHMCQLLCSVPAALASSSRMHSISTSHDFHEDTLHDASKGERGAGVPRCFAHTSH